MRAHLLGPDAVREVAAQHLPGVDADGVAVLQSRAPFHRKLAHQDRPIRVQHLEFAHAIFVVAEDFQQHLAARAGREQDVVGSSSEGLFETR